MGENEEHKVDRTGWGSGPWDNEPDRLEWKDEKTSMPCLMVRNDMGNWCGYVCTWGFSTRNESLRPLVSSASHRRRSHDDHH